MEATATEKIFFDAHGIKVTNARFIVTKQTYAMASVNSVKVDKTDRTPPKSGAIFFCVLGGLMIFASISDFKGLWLLALIGLGTLIWGVKWYGSIKPKFEYKLNLTTSSGETTALTSFSEPDIRVVEDALNNAIVYRG